ncbi:MAG TPA: class I SAM-dependent methyltransferase [Pseudonocardiaceae bacterium]
MTAHDDTPGSPRPYDLIGPRLEQSFRDRSAQVEEVDWALGLLPDDARVLDVGCGGGVPTAKQLADAGATVVGIDESAVMLELARSRVPSGTFLLQDFRGIGPELGEYDAVTCFFALLMLGRDEIPAVLRCIRERLRGPRVLALSMVLGDLDRVTIPLLGVPVEVSAYPPDQLVQVVSAAGFNVLGIREAHAEVDPANPETQLYLRAVAR